MKVINSKTQRKDKCSKMNNEHRSAKCYATCVICYTRLAEVRKYANTPSRYASELSESTQTSLDVMQIGQAVIKKNFFTVIVRLNVV